MQLTPEVWGSGGSAVVAVAVAAFAWRRRSAPAVRALVAFNLGVAVWTGGNAGQVAATTKAGKLLWVNVQYVGIAAIPVAGFAFGARFGGREELATRRRLALVAAPLAALVLLSWTNAWHGLVRQSASLTTAAGVVALERTFGPAFWVGWLYSQAVLLAASALVLRAVLYTRDLYRRQVAALSLGAVVPWVAQLLFLWGASPFEPEVFFAVSGGAFVYAATRFRFLDLVPVARDALLELLSEGVVVVDEADRVVDFNDAAATVLPGLAVGEPVDDALADHDELLDAYRTGTDAAVDLATPDGRRRFDVQVTALPRRAGRALVLHDVTALAEREAELERKNRRLEEFAAVVSHDLRSPLSVATGYVSLERKQRDSERLERAAEALERMDDIIDDLLTLTREGDVAAHPVSLGEVARTARDHVDDGVAVTVEAETLVVADRDLLLRALENLLENAADHGDADEVWVVETDEGFSVVDDGSGFDDGPDAVFEWGHSADGTGIGLAIVGRVAEAHGWDVAATRGERSVAPAADGARFEFTGVEFVSPAEAVESDGG